jgi:cysteine-rich repeat protein
MLLTSACFDEAARASADPSTTGLDSASESTTLQPLATESESGHDSTTTISDVSSVGADTSSSGGNGPVCGDGLVEGDEICDDENDVPGDGCTLCETSGTPLWIFTDGTGAPTEGATAVALAGGGAGIVLVGALAIDGQDTDVWLEVLDADGGSVLRRAVDGDGANDDAAFDVRVRATGDMTVVGEISTPASGTNLWVGQYDSRGDLLGQSQAGSTVGGDAARSVALLANDEVVVAGRVFFAAVNDDAWLGRFAGSELSESVFCDCGPVGQAASVVADAQGRVRVAWLSGMAWQLVGFDQPIGVAQPMPSWVVPLEGIVGAPALDVDEDGGLSLCAAIEDGNDNALSLQTFAADGTAELSMTYDVGDGDHRCAGILGVGDGFVLVGEIRGNTDDARGLLVAVDASNGAVRYTTELVIDDAEETVINDVVVDSDGAVFVVGAFSNGGGDFDPFAARLVP